MLVEYELGRKMKYSKAQPERKKEKKRVKKNKSPGSSGFSDKKLSRGKVSSG